MHCSSSETISVLDYGPCGESGTVNFQLSRGFHPGMVLNLIATTTSRSGFNIKDACGNILLHVNPRIDENVIVLNSHFGRWGAEERPHQMPVTSGVKYNLLIAYQSEGYKIFFNGEDFYFYKHRKGNPPVSFELINGGQLFLLTYKINEPKWAIQDVSCGLNVQEFPHGRPTPLDIQLQGCNSFSWMILTGTINCNAERFDINLIDSCGEIIFHFNPRFTENCVVRNSLLMKRWGNEERHGNMPFQKNQRYVIAIVAEPSCYKTYVNGEEFITYNHRKPAATVVRLNIANHINIFKVVYKK